MSLLSQIGGRKRAAEDPENPDEEEGKKTKTEDPETPEEEAKKAATPEAPEKEASAPDGGDAAGAGRAGTFAEGHKAERDRIAAIQNAPEAKGREGLAQSLALDTDMDAATARTVLGKAAKESGGLAAAMAGVPNPDVGPDGGAADREAATPGRSLVDACKRRGAATLENRSN